MSRYRFTRTVTVDGVKCEGGHEFAEGDIPADHLACCLRLGHVEKVEDPSPAPIVPPVPPVEEPIVDLADTAPADEAGEESEHEADGDDAEHGPDSEHKPRKRRRR